MQICYFRQLPLDSYFLGENFITDNPKLHKWCELMDPLSVSGWVVAGVLAIDRIRLKAASRPNVTDEDIEYILRDMKELKERLKKAS